MIASCLWLPLVSNQPLAHDAALGTHGVGERISQETQRVRRSDLCNREHRSIGAAKTVESTPAEAARWVDTDIIVVLRCCVISV